MMKVESGLDSSIIGPGPFIVLDSGKSNDDDGDENDDDEDDDDDEREDDRISEEPSASSSIPLSNSSSVPVRIQQTSASISASISFSVIRSISPLATNHFSTN